MGALSHVVTYQDYPATAMQLRWDAGLEPSSGFVDLNLEDVKRILIDVRPLPWHGNVFPGLISIKASQRGTVAAAPGRSSNPGSGFFNYGDLVLKSFDGSAPFHTPITYKNLYIAESGVEEIERELGRVRLHQEGKIRVQLTDIRMFYRKHGALLQRFNVRRPGGEIDQLTMKASGSEVAPQAPGQQSGSTTGDSAFGNSDYTQVEPAPGGSTSYRPWTAKELMTHFLAMLPGAPAMHADSHFAKDALEPPMDIIGEGEPIVEWIAKLLAQYGYEAHLLPDSATYLIQRLGSKVEAGKIATAPGQLEAATDVHYERKTTWIKNRPVAVSVLGKRRVRRVSQVYVPIFQSSDDGLLYKLSAVGSIYGYSTSQLNKQVMIGHEKNFRDVPPLGTAKAFRRAQSLRKCAYRMYAPASAFPDGKDRCTLQDLQRQAFMPMKKCPVYLDELKAWLGVEEDVQESQTGDAGPFALVAPIVRAFRYGQGFFKDFGAIKEHFQLVMQSVDRELAWANNLQQMTQTRLNNPGLLKPHEQMDAGFGDASKFFSKVAKDAISKRVDEEMVRVAKLGQALTKDDAARIMKDEELQALKPVTQQEFQLAKESVDEARTWQRAVQREFEKYQKAFAGGGGIHMKCQLPYGPVERGHYSINTETGVLMFGDPAVRLLQPFLPDNDTGSVRADGDVTVTFGYELNSNTPLDFTTVSFVPDEPNADDAPTAKVVSLCYPVGVPSHVEHASSMQLYEDQNGMPFNQTAVITEAASYAKSILEVPHRVDGYTYELDGLRSAVLEAGFTSIQHTWDADDGKAYTHVQANAPYARSIIPGRMKETSVATVEDRRRIETSKRNEDQ